MSLVLVRNDGETWREAALREARRYGLEQEVGDEYERLIRAGEEEGPAAWAACSEWDVLEYRDTP